MRVPAYGRGLARCPFSGGYRAGPQGVALQKGLVMFGIRERRQARREAARAAMAVGYRRVWQQAREGGNVHCVQAVCNKCAAAMTGTWGGVKMTRAEAVGEHCRRCGRIW